VPAQEHVKVLESTPNGNVYSIAACYIRNTQVDHGPFQNVVQQWDAKEHIDSIKYNTLVLLNIQTTPAKVDAIFEDLTRQGCGIIGVMQVSVQFCSVVCRRTKPKTVFRLPSDTRCLQVYVLPRNRGKMVANGPALFYDTLKAWFMTGTACRVNFQLGEIDIWTKDAVLSHWYHMSADDILDDIYDCSEKVIMKRTPTARDLYIHKMGKSLHEVLKHMREGGNTCIHLQMTTG
jgi:hypothetical protein